MKGGHPSKEHSHGKTQAHEVKRDHSGELKRGADHLRANHREGRREVDRSHLSSKKDR